MSIKPSCGHQETEKTHTHTQVKAVYCFLTHAFINVTPSRTVLLITQSYELQRSECQWNRPILE